MTSLTAIILAAGKGTRMKSSLPKVLHPLGGIPMVGYPLMTVSTLAPQQVIAVVGPQMDNVADAVRSYIPKAQIVVQQEQKGTGHAVQQALPHVTPKGIALVLYGDTPFITEASLRALMDACLEGKTTALALMAFNAKDPGRYGRVILQDNNNAEAIVEYKDASEAQRAISLCNSGVMAIRAELLGKLLGALKNTNASGEYYLTDIVQHARAQGYHCKVTIGQEQEVLGINSQAERAVAEQLLQQQLRLKVMEEGACLIAPETVFLHHDTKLGREVVIHPYVTFGPGVVVEEGAEVKSFCHIEKTRIGKQAVVGPYARLRPGTVLEEGSHIGNFVEVKNATIGKGAKANHLTYLGDASVGAGSNIGAGTITCNYDGFAKHQTNIGEGVFVGSNTSLIAPVSIGDNAVIGAGSTIFKDVPAEALARNEMPQLHVEKKATEYRAKRKKK